MTKLYLHNKKEQKIISKNQNKKISVIIQARMNSTRFTGKIMKEINGKTILSYVIDQVSASKFVDEVIISTTKYTIDKPIIEFCKNNSIKYFQGSNEDVLDRYYQTAKKFQCDTIVRISSDCPLIDPDVIDKAVSKFLSNSYDYVSNNIEKKLGLWRNSLCNFPQGMVVEVSSFESLKKTWLEAKKLSEREHVFPYIQFNPKKFKISTIRNNHNLSHIRCTIDYIQDLDFLNNLIQKLPKDKKIIKIKDIELTIKKYPSLIKINNFIEFDEGYKKSVQKDIEFNSSKIKKKSKNLKFLFIVEGNHKIGLGHVYRTINLSNEILKNNHQVLILTKDKVAKKIISKNHTCKIYSKLNDKKNLSLLKSFKPDLIILDKLQEQSHEIKFLKKYGKILSIDYTGRNYELIDYGINFLYPSKIKHSFSGFEYSILKKEFSEGGKYIPKKSVKSILILQGASDTHCFIPKIIMALNRINFSFKITVVTGSTFECGKTLKKILLKNSKEIKILHDISNMQDVMKNHDLAVTAAGITIFELACIGVPSIIVCSERFEIKTAEIMEKNHFGINLGFGKDVSIKKISDEINDLILNYDLRVKMNLNGKKLVDGKGSKRVVSVLEDICRQK